MLSRQLIAVVTIFFCVFTATAGQPDIAPVAATPSASGWEFTVAPYGWIFGLKGFLTVKGRQSDVDTTPQDVIDNFEKIDAVFQLHLEAMKDRTWGFMLNTDYLKARENVERDIFGATITPTLWVTDFGAYYTVFNRNSFHGIHRLGLQLFGGGRYLDVSLALDPRRLPEIKGSQSFISPLVGGRLIVAATPCFRLIFMGNIGGFGVDDANFTWTTSVMAHIFIKHWIALGLGWRAMGLDYDRGRGNNKFAMHTTLFGPIAGLVIRF